MQLAKHRQGVESMMRGCVAFSGPHAVDPGRVPRGHADEELSPIYSLRPLSLSDQRSSVIMPVGRIVSHDLVVMRGQKADMPDRGTLLTAAHGNIGTRRFTGNDRSRAALSFAGRDESMKSGG